LAAVARCARDRYTSFADSTLLLESAARGYAQAPTAQAALAAQVAWKNTMAIWEEVELFRFGPLSPNNEPGGKGLRDDIYSFPLLSPCLIDEQLIDRTYQQAEFPTSRVNARGLGAFEYLAFHTGNNSCTNYSEINALGTWARESPVEITQRRADYAARVASDVATFARNLVGAWDPNGGNFEGQLREPGSGTYDTDLHALNAVSNAIFYLEIEVKDYKVGRPAGYFDCFEATCPDLVESRFARLSNTHIAANLRGFRRLFQGCGARGAGLGFDDWLREAGNPGLVDRMLTALDTAEATLRELGPIEDLVNSDPDQVRNFHKVLKGITDPLKTEFMTTLNLELPKNAPSDND
jgi:predicted lipoprotein